MSSSADLAAGQTPRARRPGPVRGWSARGWSVRDWPVWALAPRLRAYVLAVIAAGLAALAVAAVLTRWQSRDALLYAGLMAVGVVTVESVRRVGEPALASKDAHGIWELALAVVLPPFYAMTAPIMVLALTQWRIRRTLAHRRIFTAAAVGLSYGVASLAFHAAWRQPWYLPGTHAGVPAWLLLASCCAALRWILNNALVVAAIKMTDPAARLRDLFGGGPDALHNDAAELCLGVLVAYCAATTPLVLVFTLPCGALLQRSARHAQLVHASRTDAKTGLLSAVTWQHEAAVQVARAVRTGTPLSVAMVDIDHFKAVNDTYGHLAGDGVLQAVARILTAGMREYDLAGRFGGEEFTLLLPHADAAEALRIAERLRTALATVTLPGDPAAGERPHITVSIGVATLTSGISDLTELLAAADAALYRAKGSGRNAVRCTGQPSPAP